MSLASEIEKTFQQQFGEQPFVFCAPGRINLIGEHTDYNNGLVLPAAIDKHVVLAIAKRTDNEIHIFSQDYQEMHVSSLTSLSKSENLWPDYINGVIGQMLGDGKELTGVNIAFGGDIPQGAGLSSSAALECATAVALNTVFNLGYTSLQLARIGQAAENQFVGVNCGLMDQFASVFGKAGHLIKLDCESFEHTYIPFNSKDYSVILFDTQVKHSLASSAYNERRRQCEYGVELISKHHPEVTSLRHATPEMLRNYVQPVDKVVYDRCDFVVSEIQRLHDACDDLIAGDFIQFGKRMFETHHGLQHKYEVSCRELDFLVDFVRDYPEVIGSRMMGGGFGGCTINLVKTDALATLSDRASRAYKEALGIDMKVYQVAIVDGARILSDNSELQ